MSTPKRKFTSDPTTGFGSNSKESGGRFYKKDGTTNIVKKGVHLLDRYSWYHTMLYLKGWKFILLLGFALASGLFY
jgi:inward rectifier potassium channel